MNLLYCYSSTKCTGALRNKFDVNEYSAALEAGT